MAYQNQPPGWESAVLQAGGWPDTPQNRQFLATWGQYEGQYYATNNPLGVTIAEGQPTTGQTVPGTPGVLFFPSMQAGAAATAAFIKREGYSSIDALLSTGNAGSILTAGGAAVANVASEIARWGTTTFANILRGGGGTVASDPGAGAASATKGKPCNPWCLGSSHVFGIPLPGCEGCQESAVSSAIGGTVGAVKSVGDLIGKLFDPAFWLQVGEVVAGGILVLVGLFMVAKHLGISFPAPPVPIPA